MAAEISNLHSSGRGTVPTIVKTNKASDEAALEADRTNDGRCLAARIRFHTMSRVAIESIHVIEQDQWLAPSNKRRLLGSYEALSDGFDAGVPMKRC
jgi:transcriptional regulator NrdR family protein